VCHPQATARPTFQVDRIVFDQPTSIQSQITAILLLGIRAGKAYHGNPLLQVFQAE
jgi:hypothetical protein